jgi:hypothetical protein
MDGGLRASAVERRPVCLGDIRLGVVVDLLLDDPLQRVLGFDVLCGDRAHRYLPLLACEVREDELSVSSALVLMAQELDFYRERCRALSALRGFPARRGAHELGTLVDFVFAAGGELLAVVLEHDGTEMTEPFDRGLLLGPDALRPAV